MSLTIREKKLWHPELDSPCDPIVRKKPVVGTSLYLMDACSPTQEDVSNFRFRDPMVFRSEKRVRMLEERSLARSMVTRLASVLGGNACGYQHV